MAAPAAADPAPAAAAPPAAADGAAADAAPAGDDAPDWGTDDGRGRGRGRGRGTRGRGAAKKKAAGPPAEQHEVKLAFQFTIPAKVAGEKTAAQIKAPIKDALMTYGPVDEVRVAGADEGGKTITVVIVKNLLTKGTALKEALEKDNKEGSVFNVFDTKFTVTKVAIEKSSKGGAHSGTSQRKSANPPRGGRGGRGRGDSEAGGRGGARGGAAPRGGAARGGKGDDKKADKKGADKKDDKKKK